MVKNDIDKGNSGESDKHESFSMLSSWSIGSGLLIFGIIERELWIFEYSVNSMESSWNDAYYKPNLLRCYNKTIVYFYLLIRTYIKTIVYK